MTLVECTNVGRRYGRGDGAVAAVQGATLAIAAGEFVAIQGPSGSGKSTLLGLIAGLEVADSGAVAVLGHDLSRLSASERARLRRSRIGIVFQTAGLVASLDVAQNVALPLRLDGAAADTATERALEALSAVELTPFASARVDELSGGERQRAAIARAVVGEPALILADEPSGSLDERQGTRIIELMRERARASGAALVLVTHDRRSAGLADRSLTMRDGRVVPS